MRFDGIKYEGNMKDVQNECKKYLYYNVTLMLSDGCMFDGIIERVEDDRIIMLVGEDVMEPDDDAEDTYDKNRQQFNRRPRRRFRRFRRRFFPFGNVVGLELLPFIHPHPFLFY